MFVEKKLNTVPDEKIEAAYDRGYANGKLDQMIDNQDYFVNMLIKNSVEIKELKEMVNDLRKQNEELLAKKIEQVDASC